jgi:hypothetical protein
VIPADGKNILRLGISGYDEIGSYASEAPGAVVRARSSEPSHGERRGYHRTAGGFEREVASQPMSA